MKSTRQTLVSRAAETIRTADSVLLACHMRPDADALGSLLGLALGLESLGKQVTAVSTDGVPELYRFLPGWERVRATASGSWDLGIGLDADGSDRLGTAEALVLAQPVVIDVDHHTGDEPFGQVRLIDPTAAATGELVFELLAELGAPLTPEIAANLMAAILTDTGSFRFTNVTPRVFEIAAALVAAGARPGPIYEAVYGARGFAASRLLGRLLQRLERTADGRIVWGCLTLDDFAAEGVGSEATEGFIDQVRMVSGSEVSIFFREEPGGEIRVSLRSRGKVNVARIAEQFGGGGHVPAAGCSLWTSLLEAVRQVVGAAERSFRENGAGDGAAGNPGPS